MLGFRYSSVRTRSARERERSVRLCAWHAACGTLYHDDSDTGMRHWHCQPVREPSPIDIQHFNAETFCLYALKLKFWSCLLRFGHLAKAIKYLICYGNCICYGAIFPQIVFSNSRERVSPLRVCILVCAYVLEHCMNEFISATTIQYSTKLCSFFTILITHFKIMHITQSKLYPSFWFRKTFSLTFHFFGSWTI